jgi:hypothetical protein
MEMEGARSVLPEASFVASDLVGLKYFDALHGLLGRLHAHHDHPNRLLHYDEYLSLLLLYFFNPVVTSLRGIQFASQLERVQKQLGVKRSSLGSLSEAGHVFDPNLAREVFEDLARQACAANAPSRPAGVPAALSIVAADGTLLEALPKMLWALWLGPHDHAVKLHFQFDVLRGVPIDVALTDGQASEKDTLAAHLRAACVYVVDRGYRDYAFFQQIIDAKSSFVARLQNNAAYEVVETRVLSGAARAAGVESDQVVWLGGRQSGVQLRQPVRLIKVHVKNPPAHSLKPRGARVDPKTKQVRIGEEEFDLWLVTDRLDLTPEMVALLYRYRWQIELFFRWFKCVLGCKHLLAQSEQGIRIEIYAALIATLLIVLWTGRKPTKRTLEMLQFHFQGWASATEVDAHIASLKLTA